MFHSLMSLRRDSSAVVLAVQRVSRGTKEVELDENEAGGQPKNLRVQFELLCRGTPKRLE